MTIQCHGHWVASTCIYALLKTLIFDSLISNGEEGRERYGNEEEEESVRSQCLTYRNIIFDELATIDAGYANLQVIHFVTIVRKYIMFKRNIGKTLELNRANRKLAMKFIPCECLCATRTSVSVFP